MIELTIVSAELPQNGLQQPIMPLTIESQFDLQGFNTFSVPSEAEYFCSARSMPEIEEALEYARTQQLSITILGGGSNVVLKDKLPGLCVHVGVRGIDRTGSSVHVKAGEVWHNTVQWMLHEGLFGFENLALIPGQIGAAPIQNIGAYGVEVAERITKVLGFDVRSGEAFELNNADCRFGYRDSIFKSSHDNRLITSVVFEMDETFNPRLEYSGIRDRLGVGDATPQGVFDAICEIRKAKLPDPNHVGNAGSFFKNPTVSQDKFQYLKEHLPSLEGHPFPSVNSEKEMKVSAAKLIESAGLKGVMVGGAAVSRQHALVIENQNHATGQDVIELAKVIQRSVAERFDVELDIEPRVLPAT